MRNIDMDSPDTTAQKQKKEKELEYVIVRTQSAGCFAGLLHARKGKEVVLLQARRLWKWAGAASLSQLAQSGTSKPNECLFPETVSKIILIEAIEIISVTSTARKSIQEVAVWRVK